MPNPGDARLVDPKHVFGYKDAEGRPFDKDKLGRPIEHGLGAKGHETAQHYQAIVKYDLNLEAKKAAQAALDKLLKSGGGTGEPEQF